MIPPETTDHDVVAPWPELHSAAQTKWSNVVPAQWTSMVVEPTLFTTPYQISMASPLGWFVNPVDLAACQVMRLLLSVIEVTSEVPDDGAVWAMTSMTSPTAAVVTGSVVPVLFSTG